MEDINMHSVYKKEIAQREDILKKVRNNIKISPGERMWLVTHPLYNQQWGPEIFNIAIEQIAPNKWFLLKIKVESISYDRRIIPIISVPAAKGRIIADFNLYDCNRKAKAEKVIKMLGLELHNNVFEYEIEYFSNLGLLSVQYECDYFDAKQNLNIREASSSGNPDFAMIRQSIDNHTVRYYCKSPNSHSFDALVFNIKWEEKKTGDGSLIDKED